MRLAPVIPVLVLAVSVSGCTGEAPPPATCGEAECASICASVEPATAGVPQAGGETVVLSELEAEIIGPQLEALRAGIQPFDAESVGLCEQVGKRDCGTFHGLDAGPLPPGEHMLFGAFTVPDVGEEGAWTVDLSTECETVDDGGDVIDERSSTKTYEVKYPGPDRAYRLAPLRRITSPDPRGTQTCTWKMDLAGPTASSVIEGGWVVPEAD